MKGDAAATGAPVMAETTAASAGAWPAIWSLMAGVCVLITAEFLPAGLLTPIARDLKVSEAFAGQAVTATAVAGLFAALLTASATRRLDRRLVMVGFLLLMVLSSVLVAAASGLWLVLLARLLLGVALGGFWSMATAVTIRLVPPAKQPRALSVVFTGIPIAMVAMVPVASYLGLLYGWRIVFLLAAGLGIVTLVVQAMTLPRLKSKETTQLRTLLSVMRRPGIGLAMGCIALIYGSNFALFTYLRPYLEHAAALPGDEVSIIFMTFGIANLFGTVLAGWLVARSLRSTLSLMPMLMGLAALTLALAQLGFLYTAGAVAIWGIAYGAIPVSWLDYVARLVPDETESGGGLVIAAVQLSITLGAAGGGVIETFAGDKGVFGAAGAIAIAASVIVYARIADLPSPAAD